MRPRSLYRPVLRSGVQLTLGVSLLAGLADAQAPAAAQGQATAAAAQAQAAAETSQAQGASPTAGAVAANSPSLVVSPGDLINIEVFNTPELSGKFRVDQTGKVSLLQGGVVTLGGLSALEAGQAIERRLREAQIMIDPHVNVFVQEYASQGVIVMGEVRSPGTYTLLGEHSLYGALAAAGGPTLNQGSTIVVTHQADPDPMHKVIVPVSSPNFSELQRSTRVNPGDTVFVSRASMFYVVGNVARPGPYPLPWGQPVRVLEAISLAEGTQRATADSKASIIRQTPSGPKTIPIDIKKIYKNEVPDTPLEAMDVLVIPRSGLKAVLDTTLPLASAATLNAVINALIYK